MVLPDCVQHPLFPLYRALCSLRIDPLLFVTSAKIEASILVRNLYPIFRHLNRCIWLASPSNPAFGIRVVCPVTNHCGVFSSPSKMGSNRASRIFRFLPIFFHQNTSIEFLPAAFQHPTFQICFRSSSNVGLSGQVFSALRSDNLQVLMSTELESHISSSSRIPFQFVWISSIQSAWAVWSVSVTKALSPLMQNLLYWCTRFCLAFRSRKCLNLIRIIF